MERGVSRGASISSSETPRARARARNEVLTSFSTQGEVFTQTLDPLVDEASRRISGVTGVESQMLSFACEVARLAACGESRPGWSSCTLCAICSMSYVQQHRDDHVLGEAFVVSSRGEVGLTMSWYIILPWRLTLGALFGSVGESEGQPEDECFRLIQLDAMELGHRLGVQPPMQPESYLVSFISFRPSFVRPVVASHTESCTFLHVGQRAKRLSSSPSPEGERASPAGRTRPRKAVK